MHLNLKSCFKNGDEIIRQLGGILRASAPLVQLLAHNGHGLNVEIAVGQVHLIDVNLHLLVG